MEKLIRVFEGITAALWAITILYSIFLFSLGGFLLNDILQDRCNECGTQFSSVEDFYVHSDEEWDKGNDHGSYTEVPGESYWVKTGQHWVVDEPAQEEQGHWEYK